MSFDTLSNANAEIKVNMTAGKTPVSGGPPSSNPLTFDKKITYTLGSGALQINNAYCAVLSLAPSANTNIDIADSLTNLANEVLTTFTGAKLLVIVLLGAGDTAPDGTTVGTAASSITIGNGSTPCLFGFDAGTDTWTIQNGDFFAASNSTAGGWAVTDTTADSLKILNNDGALTAKVLVIIAGK